MIIIGSVVTLRDRLNWGKPMGDIYEMSLTASKPSEL